MEQWIRRVNDNGAIVGGGSLYFPTITRPGNSVWVIKLDHLRNAVFRRRAAFNYLAQASGYYIIVSGLLPYYHTTWICRGSMNEPHEDNCGPTVTGSRITRDVSTSLVYPSSLLMAYNSLVAWP